MNKICEIKFSVGCLVWSWCSIWLCQDILQLLLRLTLNFRSTSRQIRSKLVKVGKSRKKFWCPGFSKKMNAGAFLCTGNCPSVRFFLENLGHQFFFEIYWPLVRIFGRQFTVPSLSSSLHRHRSLLRMNKKTKLCIFWIEVSSK